MSHWEINIPGPKGEGENIRYEPQKNSGFTHGTNLECRKCHGKFKKLLTKAEMCKQCYRLKDIVKKRK